jgi:NADP-dependent 3-hydroxy acid dehydrogenase YdfG
MKQEAKKTAIITGSSRGIGKETVIYQLIVPGLAESLALEVREYWNIRVLTTKIWQEYDFRYYQKKEQNAPT